MTVAKAIMILARSAAEAAAMAVKHAVGFSQVVPAGATTYFFSDGSTIVCDGPRYFAG